MMVIDNKYEIGDIVYIVTDEDQKKRMVTSIVIYKAGEIVYKIVCGTNYSEHYDFELSDKKNILANV